MIVDYRTDLALAPPFHNPFTTFSTIGHEPTLPHHSALRKLPNHRLPLPIKALPHQHLNPLDLNFSTCSALIVSTESTPDTPRNSRAGAVRKATSLGQQELIEPVVRLIHPQNIRGTLESQDQPIGSGTDNAIVECEAEAEISSENIVSEDGRKRPNDRLMVLARNDRRHSWSPGFIWNQHFVRPAPSIESAIAATGIPRTEIEDNTEGLAQSALEENLEAQNQHFHDSLTEVPESNIRFNFGQFLESPRSCRSTDSVYPGPRCISNIDEIISARTFFDKATQSFTEAYRVHVKGRYHDDYVWANDLRLDPRYSPAVDLFEGSIRRDEKGIWSWATAKLRDYRHLLDPIAERIEVLTAQSSRYRSRRKQRPAIEKNLFISQNEYGEDIIVFR
ncbi:hypothetical protein DFH27DRAFT_616450 [Peziza echinospora]|nr:hypothetical protein DFH27DRAFT_616450 [Peziza echinospora]